MAWILQYTVNLNFRGLNRLECGAEVWLLRKEVKNKYFRNVKDHDLLP